MPLRAAVTLRQTIFVAADSARWGCEDGGVRWRGRYSRERKFECGGRWRDHADAAVNLAASYIALGTTFRAPFSPLDVQTPSLGSLPFNFDPTHGAGSITARAELIDVGDLSLQNSGQLKLLAEGGDIRGDGTISVAGEIRLRAGRLRAHRDSVYHRSFRFFVGRNGAKRRGRNRRSGNACLPLSAGSELNVYASTIEQGGVLRAPLGSSIWLGRDR